VVLTFSVLRGIMGEESVAAITNSLMSDLSPDVRRHAAFCIGFLNKVEYAEVLIQALKDDDWGVRLEVVNGLEFIMEDDDYDDDEPDLQVLSGLLHALGDNNLFVRMKALQCLLRMNDYRTINDEINKMITQCKDKTPVLKE